MKYWLILLVVLLLSCQTTLEFKLGADTEQELDIDSLLGEEDELIEDQPVQKKEKKSLFSFTTEETEDVELTCDCKGFDSTIQSEYGNLKATFYKSGEKIDHSQDGSHARSIAIALGGSLCTSEQLDDFALKIETLLSSVHWCTTSAGDICPETAGTGYDFCNLS